MEKSGEMTLSYDEVKTIGKAYRFIRDSFGIGYEADNFHGQKAKMQRIRECGKTANRVCKDLKGILQM